MPEIGWAKPWTKPDVGPIPVCADATAGIRNVVRTKAARVKKRGIFFSKGIVLFTCDPNLSYNASSQTAYF
jgi:hypothetical protein